MEGNISTRLSRGYLFLVPGASASGLKSSKIPSEVGDKAKKLIYEKIEELFTTLDSAEKSERLTGNFECLKKLKVCLCIPVDVTALAPCSLGLVQLFTSGSAHI